MIPTYPHGAPYARFVVPGIPRPQGSKTPGITTRGDLYVRENNAASHKAWRDMVDMKAREARRGRPKLQGPVRFECVFAFPMTNDLARRFVGRPEPYTHPKISAPDLDKLIRCVWDSLTSSEIIGDDAQITECAARKEYSTRPPGAWITLYPVIDPFAGSQLQLETR